MASQQCNLVFFDPDNGIEVSSCKYVYWDELQLTYEAGKSLLVYQHFCRVKRDVFIHKWLDQVRMRLSVSEIITFRRTPHVLFLLIPSPTHGEFLNRQSMIVENKWDSQIQVGSLLS